MRAEGSRVVARKALERWCAREVLVGLEQGSGGRNAQVEAGPGMS